MLLHGILNRTALSGLQYQQAASGCKRQKAQQQIALNEEMHCSSRSQSSAVRDLLTKAFEALESSCW
jgi:hypothetical protein